MSDDFPTSLRPYYTVQAIQKLMNACDALDQALLPIQTIGSKEFGEVHEIKNQIQKLTFRLMKKAGEEIK